MGMHNKSDKTTRKTKYAQQFAITAANKQRKLAKELKKCEKSHK